MEKQFYVYILRNYLRTVLYTGVTSNLVRRIYEHKNKLVEGFTDKYNVDRLVYYEPHATAEAAITREKQIKAWKRDWKENLIREFNPKLSDLYEEIAG